MSEEAKPLWNELQRIDFDDGFLDLVGPPNWWVF